MSERSQKGYNPPPVENVVKPPAPPLAPAVPIEFLRKEPAIKLMMGLSLAAGNAAEAKCYLTDLDRANIGALLVLIVKRLEA